MSVDPTRDLRRESRDDALLPRALTGVLGSRVSAHFGVARSEMDVSPVRTYSDGSGAVAVFSAPARDGVPRQLSGRADMIVVSALAVGDGPAEAGLDSIRETYDHPGVRVVEMEAHGWTVAYSVFVDAGTAYAGGAVLRFVKLCGSAGLSVTLSGVRGPVDHDEARSVALAILQATGWADGSARRAVGG